MSKPSDASEKGAVARRAAPGLVVLAVFCVALLLAYLGNAAWNLLHLTQYDGERLLAAGTLPAPLVAQAPSRWIELASAAAFLLLALLTILLLRATSRGLRHKAAPPFAEADPVVIFIADKSRITHRPAPISARVPSPVLDAPPAPVDSTSIAANGMADGAANDVEASDSP